MQHKGSSYASKIRVRVCGILIEANKLLMVRHQGFGKAGHLWIPPGGGVEFGESVNEALTREFKEETGLDISVKSFLFINEFIDQPLHAMELFFLVEKVDGKLNLGFDPEFETNDQIIDDIQFHSLNQLKKMNPENIHVRFRDLQSFDRLWSSKGFFNSNDFT
ncbi:MAG: NUDIX hydrolase [Cyclobacteriaceae bacterium]